MLAEELLRRIGQRIEAWEERGKNASETYRDLASLKVEELRWAQAQVADLLVAEKREQAEAEKRRMHDLPV